MKIPYIFTVLLGKKLAYFLIQDGDTSLLPSNAKVLTIRTVKNYFSNEKKSQLEDKILLKELLSYEKD